MVTNGEKYKLLKELELLEDRDIQFSKEDSFEILRKAATDGMRKQHDHNERTYNARSRIVSFRPGHGVFRRNFQKSCFVKKFNAKLAPIFVKARVSRKLGQAYYELEDLQGKLVGFMQKI